MGHRTLTLVSLPACCVVCGGTRIVHRSLPGETAGKTTSCSHCVAGLPIAHLPIRHDIPRGGAA